MRLCVCEFVGVCKRGHVDSSVFSISFQCHMVWPGLNSEIIGDQGDGGQSTRKDHEGQGEEIYFACLCANMSVE